MLLKRAARILFVGDSITDCGRGRSGLRWDSDQHLGNGYVSLVHGALAGAYPDYGIRILNLGVSGNTVRDLAARWATDVLPLLPAWLSIMIGINDVWRHFSPFGIEPPVSLDEFGQSLDDLVRQARPRLDGLVMMTPYFLEPNRSDPMRSLMDRFGQAVRQIALEHGAIFVDTQQAFDELWPSVDPHSLAPDQVHVGEVGHTLLARTFLKGLGVNWSSSSSVPSSAEMENS